ncbi:autotransporter outer membrane beta-barrel domain-containing protein [Sutterella wadsworthensis]|uniref:autotransporter family protein n=1 Tax=Sutterella wadsworthensis TaxID=40545 RepID=UPI003966B098
MNRTFKVAKSLTRGVVVTSEKASSYQGKAVKTVVAAAVALMASGAFAAATNVTLNGEDIEVKADQEVVVTKNTETASKNEVTINVSGGKITLNNVNNTTDEQNNKEFGANLLVSGGDVVVKAGTANNFKNMAITGGTLTIDGGDTTGGAWRSTTNVGGYAWADEDGNRSTLISNATVKINNGMLWGGAESSKDEIRKASPLIIKDSKVELGGKTLDQSGILYTGTGKPMQIIGSTVSVAKDQFGTIFTPELTVENSTITNAGTLNIAFSNSQTEKVSESLNSASGAKSVDVAVAANKSVVVSNVEANYETVNVNGQGTLQLAGNDGVLFGEDVKTVKVSSGGLVLGHEQFAAKTGEIVGEVDIAEGSAVTVEAGTFAVGGLAGQGTVDVEDGGFTTNYASAEGTINVNGGVAAVLGNKPVTTATAAAGEEGAEEEPTPFEGAVKVGTVTFGATSTTTLALTPVEPTESDGIFAVGVDAATAAADVAANYDNLDGKKVVYLTKQVEFTAAPAAATDYLVDLGKVAATEHFSAEDGVMNNELGSNVKSIKLINLDAAALSGKSGEKVLQFSQKTNGSPTTVAVDFGNWFYGSSYYDQYDGVNLTGFSAASGQITFKPNEDVVDHVQDMNLGQAAIQAADEVVWGQNEIVDAIGFGTVAYAKALKDSDTYKALVQQDTDNAEAGKDTYLAQDYLDGMMDTYLDQLDIASELAIAGGVFGTTLDINDQVTAALDRRTSLANLNAPRTEGFTPWVDVFGTKNEAKRIYGEGAGYEADIYGAVLGFDYTAACGGVLGLAFDVGQADGNSVGIGSAKVENDADFYGVSLYAAQTFGDFNVKADLGYTQVKNDLKMNGVTKTWKESQDADVITFGVGTEYLVKAGALNVVPHAGIRMTRIDLDDSKYGAEYETMTVYQMPLGVAFSGTFDTNGWKVAPMVDLSVVPTFGDKDAEAKYFGGVKDVVRVVDSNPIRATIGVEAQTGAWTFGVNYGLTAGSDDRLNNSLNANARYTF